MSTAMTAVVRIGYVLEKTMPLKLQFLNCGCEFLSKKLNFSTAKVNVPSPPKRPLTAYMLFCKQNRKDVVKDNPSLSISEQIKVLAEKWTNLAQNSKKIYEDTARQGIISYGQAHKEFYENLTENQRELLLKIKADKKESRKMFKLKKALKGSGIPKHPNSAYTLFVQTKAKEKKNFISVSDFSKEVASIWRTMSAVQKQTYVEKAKLEKEEYETQMKKWRETMIDSGHSDLVKAYDENKMKGKKSSSKRDELETPNKKQ